MTTSKLLFLFKATLPRKGILCCYQTMLDSLKIYITHVPNEKLHNLGIRKY